MKDMTTSEWLHHSNKAVVYTDEKQFADSYNTIMNGNVDIDENDDFVICAKSKTFSDVMRGQEISGIVDGAIAGFAGIGISILLEEFGVYDALWNKLEGLFTSKKKKKK